MKMKKLLVTLFAAAMVTGTMVGCGASDSKESASTSVAEGETQDVTLKIWVPEEEVEITDAMVKKFDEIHEEFNITYEIAVVGIDEAPQALETDADTAADIFYTPSGGVADLASKGLLLPITKDFDEIKSDLPESAINAVTVDEISYAVPFSPNTFFMYYNKDLLTEDEVTSLDTIMAKDLGDGKYNFSTHITDSWYAEMFFLGKGCTLFGEDGKDATDCTFNNEAGVQAGEYIIDLVKNPKYIEDLDGAGGSEFKAGNLAAITSGAWSAPEFREALGDKLGAVALPKATIGGETVQLSNFVDFKTITVKSNTQYPLAAQQLAVYMGNAENCLTRYENQGDIPVLESLSGSDAIAADFVAKALNEQAANATNQPSIPKMGDYWDPMKALGEGIYYGDITSSNLQAQLDSLVDSITGTLTE
ncbi:arabinogalactan oligomer / maltooligosaccharide transport system substrate-binding protein [Pseudobutyrivibrio sp. YE44]|uniref:extracellular solute-binding protein n=1 Tax=Pseudobutyrivibrio sp. YE44 TaxID=1520802 RepID=UPI00088F2D40|nr:extracellular solute-binding protein [Pseudobutyrivibrio sp. YE44]SDB19933.1 arabinogalactan oligomer / maltooligosaccharide transport system substrate-binding protein [Pseudobutyrivibrio sp. YE44]